MALIEVTDLRKAYGRKQVLHGISFNVAESEIVGVLGPNGAGKTTAVECVGGLREPDGGRIRIAGLDPTTDPPRLRQLLGMQLQQCRLPGKVTVREALRLFASFYPDPLPPDEMIDRFGLADRADARFEKLSGGQQQRLSVALALIGRPRIAFLDELTTGLDPQARREIWDHLAQLRADGVTMLLVTHFMAEAQYLCDRVLVINDGRIIAEGSPDSLAGSTGRQETSFTAPDGFDPARLRGLAGVHDVQLGHGRIVVTGDTDSPQTVLAAMTGWAVPVSGLRVTSPTLDDAYLSLTDQRKAEQ